MKIQMILIPALFAFCICALGDPSDKFVDGVFVTTSPGNKCYAVQTIQSLRTEPVDKNTRRVITDARFQMFENKSGKLLWQADKDFGDKRDVYISDDGDHVVVIPWRFWSYGWSYTQDASQTPPAAETLEKLKSLPAISFYRRDTLLKTYTLSELDFQLTNLEVSVSHVYFIDPLQPNFYDRIEVNSTDRLYLNPRFEGNKLIVLPTDGRTRTFDYTNGKLLDTESAEDVTRRIREFEAIQKKMIKQHNMPDPFATKPADEKKTTTKLQQEN